MEIFAIKSNSKRRRSLNLPDPTLSESIALDAHRIAMRRIAWRHLKVQTRKSPSGLRDAGAKVAIGGPPEGGRRHLPINQKYHRKAQKLSATGVSLAEIPASIRQVADIVAEIDGLTGGRPARRCGHQRRRRLVELGAPRRTPLPGRRGLRPRAEGRYRTAAAPVARTPSR